MKGASQQKNPLGVLGEGEGKAVGRTRLVRGLLPAGVWAPPLGQAVRFYIQKSQGKHWTALDNQEYKNRIKQATINRFTA